MKQIAYYLAINEDGDIAGDMDADTARTRLTDDYGGEFTTMHKLMINIPEPKPITIDLPETTASVTVG